MSNPASSHLLFAHMSDVHLPPPPSLRLRAFLNKRGLSLLSWLGHRRHRYTKAVSDAVIADIKRYAPQAILNTGDLTNFGLPEEFRASAAWLKASNTPTFIVPGNHDAMVSQPWHDGLHHWSPWTADHAQGFPYVATVGFATIIGLNSAHVTPPFFACGWLGRAQRRRVKQILAQYAGTCRIVLIHHPPHKKLVSWRKSLLDWKSVARILRQNGAEIVLHGHSHRGTVSTIPLSDIPLIGVPSAANASNYPDQGAGWNAIRVAPCAEGWMIHIEKHEIGFATHSRARCSMQWIRPRGSKK